MAMLVWEFALVVVLVVVCGGAPIPNEEGLTAALNAAGAHENKYSCNCHQVPSDDGIRTLQCHCTPHKKRGNDTSTNTGTNAGTGDGGQNDQGTQPPILNGTQGPSPNVPEGGNGTGTGTDSGGEQPENGNNTAGAGSQEAQVKEEEDKIYGDDKTYVMCTKPSSSIFSTFNSKPDWKWLYVDNEEVELKGKWTKCGGVDSFQVGPKTYQTALKNCRDSGYGVAQPANSFWSGWYPFWVNGNFTEYYKENSGWGWKLTATYSKVGAGPAGNC